MVVLAEMVMGIGVVHSPGIMSIALPLLWWWQDYSFIIKKIHNDQGEQVCSQGCLGRGLPGFSHLASCPMGALHFLLLVKGIQSRKQLLPEYGQWLPMEQIP